MINSFLKDMAIYALPMFLARAVSLILLPIYTRQLGPADFGFVEFVAAMSVIILFVVTLEINQAVGRVLSDKKTLKDEQVIISTSIWFTVVMFVLFSGVVYIFRFELLHLANLPADYEQYVSIICIHLAVLALVNLLQVQFRFSTQAISSVVVNISIVLANLTFVLYFVEIGKLNIWYYFLSQILSGFLGVLIGLILLSIKFSSVFFLKHVDTIALRNLLTYSLPFVLSSIGVALSSTFDRVILGSSVGLTELGYYGAALRLSAIVGLGFYVVSSTLTPIVYRDHHKRETKSLIENVMTAAIYGCTAILLLVMISAENIIALFLGENFTQASHYIFYVTLSAMIANAYIFFLGLDIEKRTKLLSKINLCAGFGGVIGSAIFVPMWGVWGAISSTLFSNLFRLSGYIYFNQKFYPIKIPYLKLLALLLVIFIKILTDASAR